MDDIDVECYVLPKVKPFLKHPVIQLQEEVWRPAAVSDLRTILSVQYTHF